MCHLVAKGRYRGIAYGGFVGREELFPEEGRQNEELIGISLVECIRGPYAVD